MSSEREAFAFEEQTAYCVRCVSSVIRRAVSEASGQWLVVQPFGDAGCYVPYALAEIGELGDLVGWPSDIAGLLESAGPTCAQCGQAAGRFRWLATDQSQSLPEMQNNPSWFRGREAADLCEACLVAAVTASLRDRGVRVYELVLPKAGPGVWLPWGY